MKAATLREIARLGTPVGLTQILNAGMFSAAAILVGVIGATTLPLLFIHSQQPHYAP